MAQIGQAVNRPKYISGLFGPIKLWALSRPVTMQAIGPKVSRAIIRWVISRPDSKQVVVRPNCYTGSS